MFNFDEEEISKIATNVGDALIEELINDLNSSKYSVSIDNVTVTGKSICALKVKYLKEVEDENNKMSKTQICNRIIGIEYLNETSDAPTLCNIMEEKLFSLSDRIKENFIGITHDDASVLSGSNGGLVALLKRDLVDQPFYDLKDPCHALNLVVSKSLDFLPPNIMKFIKGIHNHFSYSPQRISKLIRIQINNKLSQLQPIFYVETRWLSLGQSLSRILSIWDSLKIYMNKEGKAKSKEKKKFLNDLLNDPLFKLKIICLSGILNKINQINETFQKQSLEIQCLQSETLKCFRFILEILIPYDKIPRDLTVFYDKL